MFIVAMLVSLGHWAPPPTIYLNDELVDPIASVKIDPFKLPPLPVSLVQVPPPISPVIKLYKSIV
jgi:hypothetical protein